MAHVTGADRPTASAWDGWADDPLPAPRTAVGDPPRRWLRWLAAAVAVALVFAAGLAVGALRDARPAPDPGTSPALSELLARSNAGAAASGGAVGAGAAVDEAAGSTAGAAQAPVAQPGAATQDDPAQPGADTGSAAAAPADAGASTPTPPDVTVQITEDGTAVVAQRLAPGDGVPAQLDLRLSDVGSLLAAGPPQLTSLAVQVDGQPATATPQGDAGLAYRVDSAGGTAATLGFELLGVLGPLAGAPSGAVAVVPLLAPAAGGEGTTTVSVRGSGIVDVTCPTPDGAATACGTQQGDTWTATVPLQRPVLQIALDLAAG